MKTVDFDKAINEFEINNGFNKAINKCMIDGFEGYGECCGHDCGINGIVGIIVAWEEIRTQTIANKCKSMIIDK